MSAEAARNNSGISVHNDSSLFNGPNVLRNSSETVQTHGDIVGEKHDAEKGLASLSSTATPLPGASQTLPPPDQGRAAYLTGFGSFLAHFAAYGQLTSFGIFQKYYLEHQLRGQPQSEVAWIGSLGFFLFFFSGGFVGRLFDAHGPTPLIIVGGFFIALSDMMTSLSNEYYQFILSQGILLGAGCGIVFNGCLGATATHFHKYRAVAIGISAAGGSLGGVIIPIICSYTLPSIGFPWTLRLIGFLSLFLIAMAYFTVTSRLPPRPPSPWIHRASLTDTNYLLFCTSALIGCLGLFTPFFFFSSFASSIGLSRELAFAATSVLNGGAVLGRIIPSLLADKLGRFNIFIVSGVLTGLTVLCLWTTVNNAVGMMWLAALYGFFSGSVVSLVGPCVAQISPIELIGQRLGVFYMFCSISALVGSPIGGAILAREKGSYTGLAIFSGVALLANTVMVVIARFRMNPKLLAAV